MNIDKNGKFVWQKIIPKKQVSADDGGYFLSFTMAVNGTDLYFFYNALKKEKPIILFGYYNLCMYVIDKNGELSERTILITRKDSKEIMVPKTGVQISNEIYMFGRGRYKSRFAKITLE